jgi:hypothetical protein
MPLSTAPLAWPPLIKNTQALGLDLVSLSPPSLGQERPLVMDNTLLVKPRASSAGRMALELVGLGLGADRFRSSAHPKESIL